MTMKLINLLSLLCLSLAFSGCHAFDPFRHQPKPNSQKVLVKITRVENRAEELVLNGEVINTSRRTVYRPSIGYRTLPNGVVEASFLNLSISVKAGDSWQNLSPLHDGIGQMELLEAGGLVKFEFRSGIPYPEKKGQYRVWLGGDHSALFEAGGEGEIKDLETRTYQNGGLFAKETLHLFRVALSDPKSDFTKAYHNDPSALHAIFARASDPQMKRNAEKSEGYGQGLTMLMVHLGDKRFAGALRRENPAIRESIGGTLDETITYYQLHFPETRDTWAYRSSRKDRSSFRSFP